MAPRIEILAGSDTLFEGIVGALHQRGWSAGRIQPLDLERVEREHWNLIVIGCEEVTPEALAACVRASRNPRTRVLVVSPEREPQPIADTLRAGADDYLVFPFEPAELVARAQSLVNFSLTLPARRRFGTLGFDFAARTIFDGPASVTLSRGEWGVLIALIDAAGEPVSLADLAALARHDGVGVSSVASTISRLRRKLRAHDIRGIEIDTISGRGYTLHYRPERSSW